MADKFQNQGINLKMNFGKKDQNGRDSLERMIHFFGREHVRSGTRDLPGGGDAAAHDAATQAGLSEIASRFPNAGDNEREAAALEEEVGRFLKQQESAGAPKRTVARIVRLDAVIREGTIAGLNAVVRYLVDRVRANAPMDTGALRQSVVGFVGQRQAAGGDAVEGATTSRGLFTQGGFTTAGAHRLNARLQVLAPYAFRVHEFWFPGYLGNAPAPGDYRKSKLQERTPEGGVGGKFVERVVQTHAKNLQGIMGRALIDTLANLNLISRGSRGASIGPVLQRVVRKRGASEDDGVDIIKQAIRAGTKAGFKLGPTSGRSKTVEGDE